MFELRTLLDWIGKITALDFAELLKIEDLYAELFVIQCNFKAWVEYRKRGHPMPKLYKFYYGFLIFIGIIALIYMPFFLFSSINPSFKSNQITGVNVGVELRNVKSLGNVPLFKINNFQTKTVLVTQSSRDARHGLQNDINDMFDAQSMSIEEVFISELGGNMWNVNPELKNTLLNVLGNSTLDDIDLPFLVMTFEIVRIGPASSNALTFTLDLLKANSLVTDRRNSTRMTKLQMQELHDVINGNKPEDSTFKVTDIHSLFHLLNIEAQLQQPRENITSYQMKSELFYTFENKTGGYWGIRQAFNDTEKTMGRRILGGSSGSSDESKQRLRFYFILDYFIVNSSLIDTFAASGTGSIPLFIFIFVTVGSYIRSMCTYNSRDIITKDINDVHTLFQVVDAIRLARVKGNYMLEEQLYRMLVRIYREPKLLIALTGRKEALELATAEELGFIRSHDISDDEENWPKVAEID